jgi:uncharacterized coiled-coil DUF342 family protein
LLATATQVHKRVIKRLKKENKELNSELDKAKNQLRGRTQRLYDKLTAASTENEQLRETNDTMKMELEEANDDFKIKRRQLINSKQYRKHVSTTLTTVRAERDQALEEIERLRDELEDRTADVQALTEDYERFELEALLLKGESGEGDAGKEEKLTSEHSREHTIID